MLWNPLDHTDQENLKWSYLRAIEWIYWPTFILQPIVPILLYFIPIGWIIGSIAVTNFLWEIFIVPNFISKNLSVTGIYIVKLKFVICPLMTFFIWQKGYTITAIIALIWPLISSYIIKLILMIPEAILLNKEKKPEIGTVQKHFMNLLGYNLSK